MKIGITCYPSVGGSGVLASMLGAELAGRGHDIHFISYERPFRLPRDRARMHFHPVVINDYGLFKYPDYTLPLSVKMAEVSAKERLDVLHVHYAVPHATAAVLARSMLPPRLQPKVVTTLHGTDTTLLGRDPGYGPAIRHALAASNAVTTVSHYLRRETVSLFKPSHPITVIHNFFEPRRARARREATRRSLGITDDQALLIHSSNLRPIKRIDLLLRTAALIRPRNSFKLLILAGGDFGPYERDVKRLGLQRNVVVRPNITEIEDYIQAADLGVFTSEMESFCLGILEAMALGCPSVATAVGGIPEVIEDGKSGMLVPFGKPTAMARAIESLIAAPARRAALGRAAKQRANQVFSADAIVPQYETLYRHVCR